MDGTSSTGKSVGSAMISWAILAIYLDILSGVCLLVGGGFGDLLPVEMKSLFPLDEQVETELEEAKQHLHRPSLTLSP